MLTMRLILMISAQISDIYVVIKNNLKKLMIMPKTLPTKKYFLDHL